MSKKRIESAHFKVFRKLVPDFPDGEIWHEDDPDFRVYTEAGVLGIEHAAPGSVDHTRQQVHTIAA